VTYLENQSARSAKEGKGERASPGPWLKRRDSDQAVSSRKVIKSIVSSFDGECQDHGDACDGDDTTDAASARESHASSDSNPACREQSRSPSGHLRSNAALFASQDLFWRPDETIIIIDWDDTLFPTTWLEVDMKMRVDKPLPNYQWRDLLRLPLKRAVELAKLCLSAACEYSKHVVIVTLARPPWVETCMANFAPSLADCIRENEIPIVYARQYAACVRSDAYNKRSFSSAADESGYWTSVKAAAIGAECEKCYSRYPGQTWKNVLSVGDSDFERQGTRDVIKKWCTANVRTAYQIPRAKTVKFLDDPSCDDLCNQLKLLIAWMPDLVKRDDCLNIDFDEAGMFRFGGIDEMLSGAVESPSRALIVGRLWKLDGKGDPAKAEDWMRRRMWISSTGRLWYESLREARARQYFPEVHVGLLLVSEVQDDDEVSLQINGRPVFGIKIIVPPGDSPGDSLPGEGDPFSTQIWYSKGLRTTLLAAESKKQRDEWIHHIRSFAAREGDSQLPELAS